MNTLRAIKKAIMKELRVLKREGNVVWIGSDKKWSKGLKMGGQKPVVRHPFVVVRPSEEIERTLFRQH